MGSFEGQAGKDGAPAFKPIGEWNTLEIALNEPRTIVHLNGEKVTFLSKFGPALPYTRISSLKS